MAKHKFASISLTVRDRAISSKFSTHMVSEHCTLGNYIPRRKSGIYWIQVRRAAAAAAAVEISLWTR